MNDKTKRVIRKYYEFILTRIEIFWAQRIYMHNDVNVKYMLKKKNGADTLVVVFSACTRNGLKARYNYLKTLGGVRCNRLYILDDYAEDQRGSYYIGKNFTFDEECATKALIDKIIKQVNPQKLVFCGSSKGGYAAINFGMEYDYAHIIAGAPQYYLASYLRQGNMYTLKHILGDITLEKENFLNVRLKNKIMLLKNARHCKVFLHYSNIEHTYEEHVKDLLRDLKESGYEVSEDVALYEKHGDISYYFPDYLKEQLKKIIE